LHSYSDFEQQEEAFMLKLLTATVAATVALSGVATAQDAPFALEIKARQGIMAYRQIQLMTLGAMAKGDVEYDAAKAQAAADALMAGSSINASMLFPEGSDNTANPATRALPALWTDPAVGEAGKATGEAVAAMQTAAGVDLASLQAAMGPVGDACTACHKLTRAPQQ
jgi:cytochrome c556